MVAVIFFVIAFCLAVWVTLRFVRSSELESRFANTYATYSISCGA